MLFLLFKLGNDRYAIETSRVVEVVPLLELRQIPQSPEAFAGVFNYRGKLVPAVDLCQLTVGQPAAPRLSTRIIVISCTDSKGRDQLLGLIAEHATEILRKDPNEFSRPGFKFGSGPAFGPILLDPNGAIQWINDQHLLSEQMRQMVFSEQALLTA
jgi:chemotaxis-related protein WspB